MARSRQLRLGIDHGVAAIELSSPRSRNRIDARLAAGLRDAVDSVIADDSVRVVLVTARGEDFCAGGMSLAAAGGGLGELKVAEAIARIPQPVVIALHGAVFDQGLELALAGDIRVASRDTRFAMRQVVDGGMPFDGGTQRLPRTVGHGLGLDMLLTGRELSADEAYSAGLVAMLVEPARLAAAAREVAGGIATRGRVAARFAKEAIVRGVEMPLEEGLRLEADLSLLLFSEQERVEGLSAFREKRAPRFGR